jgi:hypothetical protein
VTENSSPIDRSEDSRNEIHLQIKLIQNSLSDGDIYQNSPNKSVQSKTIRKEFDDLENLFTSDRVKIIQSLMNESTIPLEQLLGGLSLGQKGIADIESLESHDIIEVSNEDGVREVSIPYDSIKISGELSGSD